MGNLDLVGFLTVDERPADAVRFPGDFTQLVPFGTGHAVAEQWNAENLAALTREYEERWGQSAPPGDRGGPDAGPGNDAQCSRCHRGTDIAGWCTVCGMDLRPNAQHPRFSLEAHDREVVWNRSQSAEQRFREVEEAWRMARDAAAAAGDTEFNRLKWVSENPRPTVQGVYEALHGEPYPDLQPPSNSKPEPPRPRPPQGASVDELESAWCASFETGSDVDFARVLTGPGAMPRRAIAALVAELTSDGWSITNWSDERRVIHEDEVSRTEIAGVAVVLHKRSVGKEPVIDSGKRRPQVRA